MLSPEGRVQLTRPLRLGDTIPRFFEVLCRGVGACGLRQKHRRKYLCDQFFQPGTYPVPHLVLTEGLQHVGRF